MTDADLVYYEMFKQVSLTMHKNENIWSGNLYIAGYVIQLDNNIKEIKDADVKLGNLTKNITVGKTQLRKSITQQAFLIKENLRFYFQINNNIEEMQMLSYPITKLNLMTDSDFYLEATHICENAEKYATQLLSLGVTALMIADLKADLLKLYKITPERELLFTTNANLYKFIPVKIAETRIMLKKSMDTLVSNYKKANPSFITNYTFSRKRILKPGARKHYTVLISGKITQSNAIDAIGNVSVIGGKKKKMTTTDVNGNYKLKIYTKDADNITFTPPEFKTQITAITLINPEKHKKAEITINVILIKNIKIQDINNDNLS